MRKFKFLKTFEKFGPAPSPSREPETVPVAPPRPQRPSRPERPIEPEKPVKPITPPDEDERPMATEDDVADRLLRELSKRNVSYEEFKKENE